jgi:hypothetical protein
MIPDDGGWQERRLDALFEAYRRAVDEPEPGRNFMPELWAKIESRRGYSVWFKRFAGGLVTAAATAAFVLFLTAMPRNSGEGFYQATYLEVLAQDHATTGPDYAEPVSVETDSESELAREML